MVLSSRWGSAPAGFASPTLLASFLHHHPGGDPSAVATFLDACRGRRVTVAQKSMPFLARMPAL